MSRLQYIKTFTGSYEENYKIYMVIILGQQLEELQKIIMGFEFRVLENYYLIQLNILDNFQKENMISEVKEIEKILPFIENKIIEIKTKLIELN
jgi:hypothetical protein